MTHQEEEAFSRLASYRHHHSQSRINDPHFAFAWHGGSFQVLFQVGTKQNASIRDVIHMKPVRRRRGEACSS